jgi:hypothetical protein
VAVMTADRIAKIRKSGKETALRCAGGLVSILLLATMIGCAPKIYSVNMRYQPTKVIPPIVGDGRQYSLTVSSFIDRRKTDDTILIGKVIRSDGSSIPILPKYAKATDAVASALRELLIQSGYGVSLEQVLWDLEENSILPEWGTILVGGAIDELDVTCIDKIPQKLYTAKVRLTLVFADVQKKRIFYRIASQSSSSLDHVLFSEEKLESQINGVLSEAIEKILEGSEMDRQIREALKNQRP